MIVRNTRKTFWLDMWIFGMGSQAFVCFAHSCPSTLWTLCVCLSVWCSGYQAGKHLWDQYASSPSAKWKQVQFTDLEAHWSANACTRTHTHARAHTHTHARTHAHTPHTHTHTHTHTLLSWPLLYGDSSETASRLACCEWSREGGGATYFCRRASNYRSWVLFYWCTSE